MISGEMVILRAIEPSDIKMLWTWMQDDELMRLRDYPSPPRSLADVEKEYAPTDESSNDIRLAMTTREGQLIGEITLRDIDSRTGDAELTIWIGDKSFWGKGYGSDAVHALAGYAFKQLNLHRITLYVHESNTRAIRSYQKCGFVEEGRAREAEYMDGKYHDILSMGLLRREFEDAEQRREEERRRTLAGIRT